MKLAWRPVSVAVMRTGPAASRGMVNVPQVKLPLARVEVDGQMLDPEEPTGVQTTLTVWEAKKPVPFTQMTPPTIRSSGWAMMVGTTVSPAVAEFECASVPVRVYFAAGVAGITELHENVPRASAVPEHRVPGVQVTVTVSPAVNPWPSTVTVVPAIP